MIQAWFLLAALALGPGVESEFSSREPREPREPRELREAREARDTVEAVLCCARSPSSRTMMPESTPYPSSSLRAFVVVAASSNNAMRVPAGMILEPSCGADASESRCAAI